MYNHSERMKQLWKEGKYRSKIGFKHSEATLKKMSKASKRMHERLGREGHPNWRGGKIRKKSGYILIHSPNHPNRDRHNYYPEHRLVMEKFVNRLLKKKEHVHHKNGVKDDNRIENLEIKNVIPHYGSVVCPYCNKEFLIR